MLVYHSDGAVKILCKHHGLSNWNFSTIPWSEFCKIWKVMSANWVTQFVNLTVYEDGGCTFKKTFHPFKMRLNFVWRIFFTSKIPLHMMIYWGSQLRVNISKIYHFILLSYSIKITSICNDCSHQGTFCYEINRTFISDTL